MSSVQKHGFEFEQKVFALSNYKDNDEFFSSSLCHVQYTAHFDLPSWKDPTGSGIPTSIKMAKCSKNKNKNRIRIDMADARRIVSMTDICKFRLLIGVYEQKDSFKKIVEIREYLITGEAWSEMTGDVPLEVLSRYIADIKDKDHLVARANAKAWKNKIKQHYDSPLRLSPKIDSKNQRRLQCFMYLDDLEQVLSNFDDCESRVYCASEHSTHSSARPFGKDLWFLSGAPLPWFIEGKARVFKEKELSQAV